VEYQKPTLTVLGSIARNTWWGDGWWWGSHDSYCGGSEPYGGHTDDWDD
jgi:hypothetical protein